MKIELTITEAKYLALKALGIQAELKSRAGVHVLQTNAEITIVEDIDGSRTMEKSSGGS
jgi:hypothetical protein